MFSSTQYCGLLSRIPGAEKLVHKHNEYQRAGYTLNPGQLDHQSCPPKTISVADRREAGFLRASVLDVPRRYPRSERNTSTTKSLYCVAILPRGAPKMTGHLDDDQQ